MNTYRTSPGDQWYCACVGLCSITEVQVSRATPTIIYLSGTHTMRETSDIFYDTSYEKCRQWLVERYKELILNQQHIIRSMKHYSSEQRLFMSKIAAQEFTP